MPYYYKLSCEEGKITLEKSTSLEEKDSTGSSVYFKFEEDSAENIDKKVRSLLESKQAQAASPSDIQPQQAQAVSQPDIQPQQAQVTLVTSITNNQENGKLYTATCVKASGDRMDDGDDADNSDFSLGEITEIFLDIEKIMRFQSIEDMQSKGILAKKRISRNNSTVSVDSTPEYTTSSRSEKLMIATTLGEGGDVEVLLSSSNIRSKVEEAGDGGPKGKSQGDHVTAYLSFVEIVCAVTEGEELAKVPSRFQEIALCVLDEDHHEGFERAIKELDQIHTEQLDRSARKKLTTALANLHEGHPQEKLELFELVKPILPFGERENIQKLKKGLKNAEKLLFMDSISKLGTIFLEYVQKGDCIAFAKVDHRMKSEDRKAFEATEGSRVNMAAYALKSMCRLLDFSDQFNKVAGAEEKAEEKGGDLSKEVLDSFFNELCEPRSWLATGLRQLAAKYITDKEVQAYKRSCKAGEIPKDEKIRKELASKKINAIIEEVSMLLEQEASKKGASNESGAPLKRLRTSSTVSVDKKNLLLKLAKEFMNVGKGGKKIENEMALSIGKLFNDFFDFSYEVQIQRIKATYDDDGERIAQTTLLESILYKVCAKHTVVMFTAFPKLKDLDSDVRAKIINGFLTQVIERQGWGQYGTTLVKLETGMKDHAHLGDHVSNEFRMLKKAEKEKRLASIQVQAREQQEAQLAAQNKAAGVGDSGVSLVPSS